MWCGVCSPSSGEACRICRVEKSRHLTPSLSFLPPLVWSLFYSELWRVCSDTLQVISWCLLWCGCFVGVSVGLGSSYSANFPWGSTLPKSQVEKFHSITCKSQACGGYFKAPSLTLRIIFLYTIPLMHGKIKSNKSYFIDFLICYFSLSSSLNWHTIDYYRVQRVCQNFISLFFVFIFST